MRAALQLALLSCCALLAACSKSVVPEPGSAAALSVSGPVQLTLPTGSEGSVSVPVQNVSGAALTLTLVDSLGADGVYSDDEGLMVYGGQEEQQTITLQAGQQLQMPVYVDCPVNAGAYRSALGLQIQGGALVNLPVSASCTDRELPDTPMPGVKVLTDTAQIRSYDTASGQLVFQASSTFAAGLAAGDSVVTNMIPYVAPDGIQARVISVSRQADGSYLALTQQAELSDLFSSLDLHEDYKPTAQDVDFARSTVNYPGVTMSLIRPQDEGEGVVSDGGLVNFDFNRVLTGDPQNPDPNNRLTVNGTFKVNTPDLVFDSKLKVNRKRFSILPSGVSFEARSTIKFVESASLKVEGKIDLNKEERINIATISLKPLTFFVGPVPIIIRNRINIFLDLKALAQGEVRYEAQQGYSLTVGSEYRDNQINKIFDQQRSFTQTLDLKGSAELSAMLGARYTASLYGQYDFYGEAKLGPKLTAKAEDQKVDYKVDICANANAGFDDLIFNVLVKRFTINGKNVDLLNTCFSTPYAGSFDLPAPAP